MCCNVVSALWTLASFLHGRIFLSSARLTSTCPTCAVRSLCANRSLASFSAICAVGSPLAPKSASVGKVFQTGSTPRIAFTRAFWISWMCPQRRVLVCPGPDLFFCFAGAVLPLYHASLPYVANLPT